MQTTQITKKYTLFKKHYLDIKHFPKTKILAK